MVRIRYTDSVKIQISGPRRIIPYSKTEIGRLSMTWKKFLLDICDIQLDMKKEYFICTAGYSPNHSTMEGWTASINEPINAFIKKYTKKLKKYTVRLHSGPAPRKTEDNQILTQSPPAVENPNLLCSKSIVASSRNPILSLAAKKFASITPLKPNQLAELIYQQKLEQNLLENTQISNDATKIPSKRGRKKGNKKAQKSSAHSKKVSNAKHVERKITSKCKSKPSSTKIAKYEEIGMQNKSTGSSNISEKSSDKFDMLGNKMMNVGNISKTNSTAKPEQNEIILIDLVDSDDESETMDLKNVRHTQEDRLIETKYHINNLIKNVKLEYAEEHLRKERNGSDPEMQDLLTLFKKSIDNFDESLLEQIKLEVNSLTSNEIGNTNLKCSPIA